MRIVKTDDSELIVMSWKELFRQYEESIGKIISVVVQIKFNDIIILGRPMMGVVFNETGVMFENLPSGLVFIVLSSMGRRKVFLQSDPDAIGDSKITTSPIPPTETKDWPMLKAMVVGDLLVTGAGGEKAYNNATEILNLLEQEQ